MGGTRQSHPMVFVRPGGKPLARPYPSVSYVDATSLKAAVERAARHYFANVRAVHVDLDGSWRQCRGRARVVASTYPPVELKFYPAVTRSEAAQAAQEGLLP